STPTAVPTNMPSFSLPDPNELTKEPTPFPSPTAVLPTRTATNTPMPTFTPPALPQTLPDEHYWLRRPVAEDGIVWTNKHYPYGSTRGGELRPHHGVEFDVAYNTEILAAASGTVIAAGRDDLIAHGPHTNFYGNLVILEHDTPYRGHPLYTLYGHLNEVRINEGQHVEAGELLGLSGATGVADGPHMHFEVRIGENSYESTVNPLLWLWPFPDRGTVVGRVIFPDGSLAYEAPVSLSRVDAASRYATTTSYAREALNLDDVWQENFAIDDVVAGYYEVTVHVGDEKFTEEVWVYPRRTSFVEIVIED
ncbi:MAG: peptidoglycan DD-metalloendopeptidase family protein, partial [Chloroflexi bacterium]|nr:peptidoglycan DD-metalloendopeptidase family protein [Chloroflexota bacterium]